MKLIIQPPHEVRFAFEHVFEPTTPTGSDKASYSVCILIPKTNTALVQQIQQAIDQTKNEAFANGKLTKFTPEAWAQHEQMVQQIAQQTQGNTAMAASMRKGLPFTTPLKDGDIDTDREEFKGHYYINARSTNKPGVIGLNKLPLLPQDFYSGCYGAVSVNVHAYEHSSGKKGLSCGLNNIMKTREGDSFLGGSTATQDFGAPESDFGAPATDGGLLG